MVLTTTLSHQPYNSQRVDVNLYVTTGNPFVLNDLEKEQMLKDRRTVYDTLVSQGDDDDDVVDDDDDNNYDDDNNDDDDDDDNEA
jgi:hypothetical protein